MNTTPELREKMHDELIQNHAEWTTEARNGNENCGKILSRLMDTCSRERFKDQILPEQADEQWLTILADKCWLPAINLLLNGEHREYKFWTEEFEDEDTHEILEIERSEVVDWHPLFDVPTEYRQQITFKYLHYVSENKTTMTYEELEDAYDFLSFSNDLIDASASTDTADRYISIIEELVSRNDEEWKEKLVDLYYYGKPEIGIFRNNTKAKEYNPELEPYEHNDNDIYFYTLSICGSQSQLDNIQTLINELCKKCGTPDNELGMYVPVDVLVKTLVGSDEYLGNVMQMSLADNTLTLQIECESDVANVLKYAFQCAFGKMEIDYEDKGWV